MKHKKQLKGSFKNQKIPGSEIKDFTEQINHRIETVGEKLPRPEDTLQCNL